MKRIALSCLMALSQAVTFAQFKTVAETPLFKEPETGHARLLQLKNGNTIVMNLTNRNGINLTIYSQEHKMIASKHHDPSFEKLRGGCVNAIFETSGSVALLISEVEDRQPVLYRLLFDGTTGNLEREEKIAEAEKYPSKDLRWIPEYNPVNSFYVSKDPFSDNYAVFIRSTTSEVADKNQMQVVMYNGQHLEIARSYYQPSFKYASLNYLDMAVLGGDRVCLLGFAYNQIASNDREGHLVLVTLMKGSRKMTCELLDLADDRIADSAVVRFNPVTQKLMLLGSAHIEDADPQPYAGFLAIIDPFKGKTEQLVDIYPTEADTQKKKLYGANSVYTGMPQDMSVNPDGSFSIFYEEIMPEKHSPMDAQPYTYYWLDNAAVATFDVNGRMQQSSFIAKKQYLKNSNYSPFYIARRGAGAQQLIFGDQYRSFNWLHAKGRTYVLMNDAEQNAHSVNGELTQLKVPGNGQAYAFQVGVPAPERIPFFGRRKPEETHALAVFNISDYNSESNTYVTLKLEVTNSKKGAKLVWLQPEE